MLFHHGAFNDWIRKNGLSREWLRDNTLWNMKFAYMLWGIWKARNDWLFNGIYRTTYEIVKMAVNLATEAGGLLIKHGVAGRGYTAWVGWTLSEGGWVKLNTDGAKKGNIGLASAGGLIRDHQDN